MKENCATCYFRDGLECRRYPRQLGMYPTDNQHPILYEPYSAYPLVDKDDWCGEWKLKEGE